MVTNKKQHNPEARVKQGSNEDHSNPDIHSDVSLHTFFTAETRSARRVRGEISASSAPAPHLCGKKVPPTTGMLVFLNYDAVYSYV